MKTSCFTLLLYTFFVPAPALDIPEGLSVHPEANSRDLEFFNGNVRCEKRLSLCESVSQSTGIQKPIQEWIDYLERFDGNLNGTLIDDYKALLRQSRGASFSPAVDSIINLARSNGVKTILKQTRKILNQIRNIDDYESPTFERVNETITAVFTIVDQSVGLGSKMNIGFVVRSVNFMAELGLAILQGPVGIASFLFRKIFSFTSSFSLNVMALNILPNTDPRCMEKLMMCDYMKMMVDTAPAVLGGIFVEAGRRDFADERAAWLAARNKTATVDSTPNVSTP